MLDKKWIRRGESGERWTGALGGSIGVSCEHLLSFISAVLISAINLNLPPLHLSQPDCCFESSDVTAKVVLVIKRDTGHKPGQYQ